MVWYGWTVRMCVGKVGETRRRRENTPNEKDIFKDIKYYIVITIKVDCVRSVRFLISLRIAYPSISNSSSLQTDCGRMCMLIWRPFLFMQITSVLDSWRTWWLPRNSRQLLSTVNIISQWLIRIFGVDKQYPYHPRKQLKLTQSYSLPLGMYFQSRFDSHLQLFLDASVPEFIRSF